MYWKNFIWLEKYIIYPFGQSPYMICQSFFSIGPNAKAHSTVQSQATAQGTQRAVILPTREYSITPQEMKHALHQIWLNLRTSVERSPKCFDCGASLQRNFVPASLDVLAKRRTVQEAVICVSCFRRMMNTRRKHFVESGISFVQGIA